MSQRCASGLRYGRAYPTRCGHRPREADAPAIRGVRRCVIYRLERRRGGHGATDQSRGIHGGRDGRALPPLWARPHRGA